MRRRRAVAVLALVAFLGGGACGDDEAEPVETEDQVPGPVEEPGGENLDRGAEPGGTQSGDEGGGGGAGEGKGTGGEY